MYVKANLGSEILQDSSTVDSCSTSDPPQTVLTFHLKIAQLKYNTTLEVKVFKRLYEENDPHRAVFLVHFLAVAEHRHLLQLAMDPELGI